MRILPYLMLFAMTGIVFIRWKAGSEESKKADNNAKKKGDDDVKG